MEKFCPPRSGHCINLCGHTWAPCWRSTHSRTPHTRGPALLCKGTERILINQRRSNWCTGQMSCNSYPQGKGWCVKGTPKKRQVSKRQVSKPPVSKRLKRQVYKTSALPNVWFTKRQVVKTSGLQNVRLPKKHPYIFCTCCWWKSAGSVSAMFAGKVKTVFYSLF